MPFAVRKRDCTDSEGNKGSYVVINTDTNEVKS